jgi:hypothetical protein
MLPEKLPERRKDDNRKLKGKILKALQVAPDGLTLLNVVFLVSSGKHNRDDVMDIEACLGDLCVAGRARCRVTGGHMLYKFGKLEN